MPTDNITWFFKFEIQDGKLADLKVIVKDLALKVKTDEPGALDYLSVVPWVYSVLYRVQYTFHRICGHTHRQTRACLNHGHCIRCSFTLGHACIRCTMRPHARCTTPLHRFFVSDDDKTMMIFERYAVRHSFLLFSVWVECHMVVCVRGRGGVDAEDNNDSD